MFRLMARHHPAFMIAISVAVLILMPVKPNISFAAKTVVDPMQPPAYALKKFRQAKLKKGNQLRQGQSKSKNIVKPKSLLLTSILIGSNRRIAIINDTALAVGDRVGSAKLVGILKDKVQLINNGKRIELRLDKESTVIRKKAAESKL